MDVVVLLVGLAVLVGLVGVVVPVLPGSVLIGAAVLVWAVVRGGAGAWLVFAVVAVLLAAGSIGSYLWTGRRVAASGVPQRSLVLAGLAGIVGFVLVPGVGLLLAFPGALFGLEYLRLRDPAVARDSAWLALKATGIGMLLELGLALAAATTWGVAVAFGVGR
jgi:uncharacterized protein YqgC (DUF456 family)